MKRLKTHVTAALLAVGAALLIVPLVGVIYRTAAMPALKQADRILVSEPSATPPYKPGPFTVTDPETVARMVSLIENSVRDANLYDLVKLTNLRFYKGSKLQHDLRLGCSLFDLDGEQYREKTGRLEAVVEFILRSGAPLTGSAQAGSGRCKLGGELLLSCRVRNVGEREIRLPPVLRAKVSYSRRTGARHWAGDHARDFEVTSRPPGEAGECAKLAPGKVLTYIFDVPASKLEKGELRLNIEPREVTGFTTPGRFRDVPVMVD